MAELPETPEMEFPTSEKSNILRLAMVIQFIGSLAAMLIGVMMAMSTLFWMPVYGGAMMILSILEVGVGCNAGQVLTQYNNNARRMIIVVNILWIALFSGLYFPGLSLILGGSGSVVLFGVAPVVLLTIPTIILFLPSVRKRFF